MKVQMIVHIKNDDGTFEADLTAIEVNVPNYEVFTGPRIACYNPFRRTVAEMFHLLGAPRKSLCHCSY